MIIGLTGPMGSGKTKAAQILKEKGAYVIEADKIAHDLLDVPQVLKKIVKAFGPVILSNKKIDRKKLGDLVFNNPKKLKILNGILHPLIIKEIKKKIMIKDIGNWIVIDAALPHLFQGIAHEVWVVLSSRENRLKRLGKIGIDKKKALKIFKAQPSVRDYKKISDKVIINDDDIMGLRKQIFTCEKSYQKQKPRI